MPGTIVTRPEFFQNIFENQLAAQVIACYKQAYQETRIHVTL